MAESIKPILHIASDEKFMNGAIYLFEKAFPGSNHVLVPLSRFRKDFLYIKRTPFIEAVPYSNVIVERLGKRTEDYDCVILHGIVDINSSVFLSSSEKKKFIGIIWGAELYRDGNFPDKNFLGELTASITLPEHKISFKEKTIALLKGMIYRKSIGSRDDIKLALSKLSYFCSNNDLFFNDIKKRGLASKELQLIPFTYYPLEFIMKGNESLMITGNDIMLGNSASFTNNHLEAFEILKQLGIGNRKVIVPLSYGNTIYADYIEAVGLDIFKDQFHALRKFIPLEEYNRVLQVCGITIMHHYRSQAVGNIIATLWLGSKVYLSETNVFYHLLKRYGIIVCSIEKDLIKDNSEALANLSQHEIDHNRVVLKQVFSEDTVINSLRNGLLKIFYES